MLNSNKTEIKVKTCQSTIQSRRPCFTNSGVRGHAYLSRVLVDVDVNNSPMFVALLDDIVLDIHLPTRRVLAENNDALNVEDDISQDM